VGEATGDAPAAAGAGAGQGGDAAVVGERAPADDAGVPAEVASPGPVVMSAPSSGSATDTVSADASEAAGGGAAERDTGRKHSPRPAATAGQTASPRVAGEDVADVVVSAAVAAGSTADRVVPVGQGVAVTPVPVDDAPVPVVGESVGMSAAEPAAESTALSETALLTVLAPLVAPGTGGPVEPPTMWALLAFARRQIGADDTSPGDQNLLGTTPEAGEPDFTGLAPLVEAAIEPVNDLAQTGQTADGASGAEDDGQAVADLSIMQLSAPMSLAAAGNTTTTTTTTTTTSSPAIVMSLDANTPPVVTGDPTIDSVDTMTGVVTGSLNVTSTEPLIYTVPDQGAGAPGHGTVAVAADGTFTYTPTQAARLRAGLDEIEQDGFTVTVSDGQYSIAVAVTDVPVMPAELTVRSVLVSLVGEVAISPDGSLAYVTDNGFPGKVSVIDTATRTFIDTNPATPDIDRILVGLSPSGVAFSPDGSFAYVTNYFSQSVSVIDTATHTVIDANPATPEAVEPIRVFKPEGVAFSPDGSFAYVSHQMDTVSVIDTATHTVIDANPANPGVDPIWVGGFPRQVAFSPVGRFAYVTNSDGVSVIDTATHTVIDANPATPGVDVIPVGGNPSGVAFSPDGSLAYITAYITDDNGTVSVIDTATHTVIDADTATPAVDPITVGRNPRGVAFSPDGSLAYVTNYGGNTVSVIDTATQTVIDTDPATPAVDGIQVGGASGVAVSPDGRSAYVTGGGRVSVILLGVNGGSTVAVTSAGGPVSGPVTLTATASDDDGVAGVQFLANGVAVGAEDTTDPYGVSVLSTVTYDGTYMVTAVARDAAGGTTISAPVAFVVDNTAPTVAVAAPASGATVSGVVTLTATAADSVGVAGVQFLVNGFLLGAEGAGSSYSLSVPTTVADNGTYVVTARARDTVGHTTTSAPVTFVVDNTAPTVTLTAPADGATVSGVVTLTATAADNVGVAGVQFWANGAAVAAEDTGSPYSLSVLTSAADNGTYAVTAVVRDTAGNLTTSAPITVIVANGTGGPTVAVTSAGGPVSGLVTLTATASDVDGVAGVQFLVNGGPLGDEIVDAPYSLSMPTTAAHNGTYVVSARARDVLGNLTTAAPVTVVVDNTAPTVTVTAPADGATVSGLLTLAAAAADNVGVAGVQFMANGTPVGDEDTGSPYGVSMLTTAAHNGTYVVTAVARDDAGNITTSAPVTIVVEYVNQAPVVGTAAFTVTSVNTTTGVVIGSLNVTDIEPLSYTVPDEGAGAPGYGTVALAPDGTFSYTPTQAARLRAGLGEIEQDGFTVTVSDGQYSVAVGVTDVPVVPDQLTVSSTIPVGSGPRVVAFSPDGSLAYVTNLDSRTVSVIDTATHLVIDADPATPGVDPIAVGSGPYGVAFSPDGSLAYVTNPFSDTVSVIDTATHTIIDADSATPAVDPIPVGGSPTWVAFSPDGSFAYVPNYGSGTVSVIDTATHTIIDADPVAPGGDPIAVGSGPYGVAFSPDGSVAYVTNAISDTVSVIDTATHTVIDADPATPAVDSIPVGSRPFWVAFSPDGSFVYVTHEGGGMVSVIDTATHGVDPIAVGYGAIGVAFSPDGSLAYVTNANSNTMSLIDTATHTVIDPRPATPDVDGIPVGTLPSGVAVSPEGGFVYVTDLYSGTVSVISFGGNTPPVVTGDPTIDSVDTATGVVIGSLHVTDTGPLSYTVPDQGTGAPAYGTVAIAPDGTFAYTPTQAARLHAGLGEIEKDGFTVTVSDGQHSVAVAVTNVPVSSAQLTIGSTIVGGGAVAFSPDGSLAYVANGSPFSSPRTVSVIDTATHTVIDIDPTTPAVDSISVGGVPSGVAFSPDGSFAYITNSESSFLSVVRSSVSVIDTATHTVIGAIPIPGSGSAYGVAFSPDGSFAYVVTGSGNTVSVIDTATHTVIDTNPATPAVDSIPIGAVAYEMAVSPDGRFAYVVNRSDDTVSVIDTATRTVIDTDPATPVVDAISVGNHPEGVAFSPDGTLAYVVNWSDDTVSVIDTATRTVVDTNPATPAIDSILVGSGPSGVAVSPDGSLAYVTTSTSGTVSVIDTATRTVIDTDPATPGVNPIPVGRGPDKVVVSPDGSFAYVSDLFGASVITLSASTPANRAPVASSATITIPEDSLLAANLVNSSSDSDGDPLTAVLVSDVGHGALTLNPDRTFSYTPNAHYNGPDSFTYKVNDGNRDSNTATVTIVVTPVNDAPVAGADAYSTAEDTVLAIPGVSGVLANDTDPDSATTLAVLAETNKATVKGGTVTINADGSFSYAPAANFVGQDSFSYTVTDNSTTINNAATGSVTVAVGVDRPAPPDPQHPYTPGAPQPGDLPGTLRGTLNATDPHGLALSYSYAGPTTLADGSLLAVGADGTFAYQPSALASHRAAADDAAQTGADTVTFDVTVANTAGATSTFAVSLGVEPANQQPHAPATVPTAVVDPGDGTVTSSVGWADPDADTLAYRNPDGSAATSWSTAGGGTVTVQRDGSFAYTPDPYDRLNAYTHPEQDSDTFEVVVTDGHGSTQAVTVTVPIDPTAAVTHTISSPPIVGSYPQYAEWHEDGTFVVIPYTLTDTAPGPYQFTMMVLRPGETTFTTAATVIGNLEWVRSGADGTVALTTYTGSGSSTQTTVSVLRPGTFAATTIVVTGSSYDARVGADGTVALTTSTGSGSTTQTRVTVLRPGVSTPTTTIVTGTPNGVRVGADGTVAVATRTGAGTAADPYQRTVTVLRPGVSTPTTATVTGLSFISLQVGTGGTAVLTTRAGLGTAADPYQTTLTMLRPGASIPTTITVSGDPSGDAQLGADGTVAVTTRTGSGTEADPYQTTATVLRPGASTPTTITVPGDPSGDARVGADGTVALTTRIGSGSSTQTTVTVLRPGASTPAATTVTGSPSGAQVGADGTVALTTRIGSGSSTQITVTVLRPGESTPTTITLTGELWGGVWVGAGGTVALSTRTGSVTAADPYQTTLVVLGPGATTPTITTVTGNPRGLQVRADGTVAQNTYTGLGTPGAPFIYTVLVVTLAPPPTTTMV
jgi:YVTN family beta-propeller protein/VCBS repeat-containing protein